MVHVKLARSGDNIPEDISKITDHLFRQESGKMVSVLTKIFGIANLEMVEDVVQETFLSAFQNWVENGIPENPPAWLFSVARNKALNILKHNKFSVSTDFSDSASDPTPTPFSLLDNFYKTELINDDMLRMMFACCDPNISQKNQIIIILKLLCGFSTAEIAKAFLTNEETISKSLYRTKEFYRDKKISFDLPTEVELRKRTESVLASIYLIFNEGYNSTEAPEIIRNDLIYEALYLCKLLSENKHTRIPETYALMALICFHASRVESRLTAEGEIILLSEQDRIKWNEELIEKGNELMNRSAFGFTISNYHLEAAIAFEHCRAKTFGDTNWSRIVELYDKLIENSPSPVTELNKAAAIMQKDGADAALHLIENINDKKKLQSYYLYHSLLGEIHSRLNNKNKAKEFYKSAVKLTRSETVKKWLKNKIDNL
ncbi:RNA polymerase sigma factor [soil metagenome]